MPTHSIIASLSKISSKRKRPKAFKTRVGCREAKRREQLDSVWEILSESECTVFRALSARALYLSMDRPDIMHSSKELCREFARPTRNSVTKLKRLARYLVTRPRLVWHYRFNDPAQHLDIVSDTDFGGCMRTRRSTSGAVAKI